VGEGEDHDLTILDLIRHREREAVEHDDAPIGALFPLGRGFRESQDRCEHRIELVFELGAKACLTRLVVVDLVIDSGDREAVNA
jgi:hypothetical protein